MTTFIARITEALVNTVKNRFTPSVDGIVADLQRTRDKLVAHESRLLDKHDEKAEDISDLEDAIRVIEAEQEDIRKEVVRASRIAGKLDTFLA
jgi:uncharacterized protein YaaN involved in tellurite resistance